MPDLSPKQLEEVNELLVTLFAGKEPELEGVVRFNLIGKELYTDFVGRGLPLRETVFALTAKTEKLQVTVPLLAGVVRARPEPAVREVVERIIPGVLAAATPVGAAADAASWVRDALKGIDAIKTQIADNNVRAQLTSSRADLARIAGDIDMLARYKELHDCLHRIQLRPLRLTLIAIKGFRTDPTQKDTLQADSDRLRTEAKIARRAASKLPNDAGERDDELKWVNRLDNVAKGFDESIRASDVQMAMRAFYQLKEILRQIPGDLDGLMVRTAKRLQLSRLLETLQKIAAGPMQDDRVRTDLNSAIAALLMLVPDLMQRITQHTAWQQIERKLARAEDGVLQEMSEALDELQFLWPELKDLIIAITVTDSSAPWASALRDNLGKFDQALPLPAAPPVPPPAQDIFKQFRRTAADQFYLVDQELNDECGQIVKIGAPLDQLLQGVPP